MALLTWFSPPCETISSNTNTDNTYDNHTTMDELPTYEQAQAATVGAGPPAYRFGVVHTTNVSITMDESRILVFDTEGRFRESTGVREAANFTFRTSSPISGLL